MSEYQYYEFRAIDRPLTADQIRSLRGLSSRAVITPTSFQNTYNYGDFRGEPRELMERYFDAHVYVSSFGVCSFMLRLPRAALSMDDLEPYVVDELIDAWSTDQHAVIEWRIEDEPDGDWVEGEGWLSTLLPIRDELARRDYRSLYIGWLSSIQSVTGWYYDDEDDEEKDEEDPEPDHGSSRSLEPPVPPGLGDLTTAQAGLATFLHVDGDLIGAAAAASPDLLGDRPCPERVQEWVAGLSDDEVRAELARVVYGEGFEVQSELQSRFYRSTGGLESTTRANVPRRTAGQLLALAQKTAQERQRWEKEDRERRNRERLARLIPRFPRLCAEADAAARRQTASGYDEACKTLVDLRDAYGQAGRRPEFDEAFEKFWESYRGRTALKRRLLDVGLLGEG